MVNAATKPNKKNQARIAFFRLSNLIKKMNKKLSKIFMYPKMVPMKSSLGPPTYR